MSPTNTAAWLQPPRFPRVSGDEPGAGKLTTQDWKFSPRERG